MSRDLALSLWNGLIWIFYNYKQLFLRFKEEKFTSTYIYIHVQFEGKVLIVDSKSEKILFIGRLRNLVVFGSSCHAEHQISREKVFIQLFKNWKNYTSQINHVHGSFNVQSNQKIRKKLDPECVSKNAHTDKNIQIHPDFVNMHCSFFHVHLFHKQLSFLPCCLLIGLKYKNNL